MSDLGDDEMVPTGQHRCDIKRKRRGLIRAGEHGVCRGCGVEYVWTTSPFAQWVPRFAGDPFPDRRGRR